MPASSINAIEYHLSAWRYLALRSLTKRWPTAAIGPAGLLKPIHREKPTLHRPDWVRVRPLLSGICGSDLTLITAQDSPSLEPTCSTLFVPGHEVVGIVESVGEKVDDLKPGTRVVMDAVLHCEIRGITPVCEQCAAKRYSLCENIVDGCVAPGLFAGFNRDLGGSWSESFLAHRSMLFAVPDVIPDEEAVLLEPFCSALHPVLHHSPSPGSRAVVFGCGTLGLLTIAALRATKFVGPIIAIAKYDFQAEIARRFGASETIKPGRRMLNEIAERTNAKLLQGTLGAATLLGGPETVYDCVGNSWSVQQSLQMTRGGGRVVMIGIAANLSVDSSCLWMKELSLLGSCGSGGEVPGQPRRRTMDESIAMAADGRIRLRELLTHRYRLSEYKSALRTALAKRGNQAIKVAFDFR